MKLAALDVGSNAVLMLIASGAGGRLEALAELARITQLGHGVERSGVLDRQCAAATLATIAEFATQARAMGARRILTAATSALRDARDGAEFIATVARETGVGLELISGQREAELNYLAARRGLELDSTKPILIFDVGGGSTEFIGCAPGAAARMRSLQLGSVRLTDRIVRHDPPSAAEMAAIGAAIDAELAKLGWEDFRPAELVGVAGTVTTLCTVALGIERLDHSVTHGMRLSRAQVEQALAQMLAAPLVARRRLPGMVEGRAEVICAGGAIVSRVMERLGAGSLIVSNRGVRWGLLYEVLGE